MREPKVWKHLGEYLHQDCMHDFESIEDAVAEFALTLTREDFNALVSYLQHFESSELPGGVAKKAWFASGTDILFSPRGKYTWSDFYRSLRASVQAKRKLERIDT